MSFGKSNKTTKTSQQSQTDPWEPTIPYLTDFLGSLNNIKGTPGPTTAQSTAYGQLTNNATTGPNYATELDQLTRDTLAAPSRAGEVDAAGRTFQERIAPIASGSNISLDNPILQQALQMVGDDASNRVRGAFAGVGRDITGNAAGQRALGKGVTEAQLPLLLGEIARQQGRTDAAIRDSATGANTTATTAQGLDTNALATRATAPSVIAAAAGERDRPANTVISLEEQLKTMPYEDLSLLAQLLLPTAGLGQQSQGTGTQKQRGTSFGLDIGKAGSALMSLF